MRPPGVTASTPRSLRRIRAPATPTDPTAGPRDIRLGNDGHTAAKIPHSLQPAAYPAPNIRS
jgi:hypothetical protein